MHHMFVFHHLLLSPTKCMIDELRLVTRVYIPNGFSILCLSTSFKFFGDFASWASKSFVFRVYRYSVWSTAYNPEHKEVMQLLVKIRF